MNLVEALAGEIREYCAAHNEPAQAKRYARYFKEGFDSWGLMDGKHPLWTLELPAWAQQYDGLGLKGFLQLGELLFHGGKYEEGSLAIHFVARFKDQVDAKAVARLAKWFEAGIGNWAHTDVLCGTVVAPLLDCGKIDLKALAAWRGSGYKYQRRAVPVAMLGLLKRSDPIPPLLEFLRPLMLDPEKWCSKDSDGFFERHGRNSRSPSRAFCSSGRTARRGSSSSTPRRK